MSLGPVATHSLLDSKHRSGRLEDIDNLRGIAILFVLLHHVHERFNGCGIYLHRGIPSWISGPLYWNGLNGVVMFFAVSGFVIMRMTLRRWGILSQIEPKAFYRFRVARI